MLGFTGKSVWLCFEKGLSPTFDSVCRLRAVSYSVMSFFSSPARLLICKGIAILRALGRGEVEQTDIVKVKGRMQLQPRIRFAPELRSPSPAVLP